MKIRTLILTTLASATLMIAAPAFAQGAGQAAYDAQMREYQRQQEEYRQARAQYDADVNGYDNNYSNDYDRGYTRASYRPYESLASVTDQNLVNKPIETIDGQYVGKITSMNFVGNLVADVEVHVTTGRVTHVNAPRIRYDEQAGVVVTDLTADQMYGRSHIDF